MKKRGVRTSQGVAFENRRITAVCEQEDPSLVSAAIAQHMLAIMELLPKLRGGAPAAAAAGGRVDRPSSKKEHGRHQSAAITSDAQLGSIKAVAAYMRVSRTWLSGVKRRADELASSGGATPFAGGKTCAAWVYEFIRRPENAAFVPTAVYRKASVSALRKGGAA